MIFLDINVKSLPQYTFDHFETACNWITLGKHDVVPTLKDKKITLILVHTYRQLVINDVTIAKKMKVLSCMFLMVSWKSYETFCN